MATSLFNRVFAMAIMIGSSAVFKMIPIESNRFALTTPGSRGITNVRIYVGINNAHEDANLGGNVPSITLWDEQGRFWGATKNHNQQVRQGDTADVTVYGKISTAGRPAYASLTYGGNDAICIAAVAFSFADHTNTMWLGDVGKQCKYMTYGSNTVVNDANYQPSCVWLDGDNSYNRHLPQRLSFHIPDFDMTPERLDQYRIMSDSLCTNKARISVSMRGKHTDKIPVFEPPLQYHKDKTDVNLERVITNRETRMSDEPRLFPWQKRTTAQAVKDKFSSIQKHVLDLVPESWKSKMPVKRSRALETVVISNSTYHSARDLCQNEHSWGPDFVSLQEQIFCDMTSRQQWPICTNSHDRACFDLKTNQFRGLEEAEVQLLLSNGTNSTVDQGFHLFSVNEDDGGVRIKPISNKAYAEVLNWD